MIKSASRFLAIAALSTCAMSVQAKEVKSPSLGSGFHFLLNAGITGGGDKIGTVTYTNGTSQDITAGGLFHFGGGVLWQAPDTPLALEATVNYHVDDTNASNGSVSFTRIPVEAIAYYTGLPRWRFGAGARFVSSPEYKSEITGISNRTLKFKNTVGAIVQVGYGFTPHAWVNVRYVVEKYQPTTYTNNGVTSDVSNTPSFNGSHAGVNFTYAF